MANFVFSLPITEPSHLVSAQDYAASVRVSLETPRVLYALCMFSISGMPSALMPQKTI